MEGHAVGELSGTGRWRLFDHDGVTAVLYEWNVKHLAGLDEPAGADRAADLRVEPQLGHGPRRRGAGPPRRLRTACRGVSRRRRSRHFLAAGVGVLIAGAVTAGLLGCGTSSTAEQPLSLRLSGSGLYPRFAVDRGDYVARCESDSPRIKVYAGQGTRVSVDGRRARSGRFDAAVGRPAGAGLRDQRRERRSAPRLRDPLPAVRLPGLELSAAAAWSDGVLHGRLPASGQGGAWIVIFDQAGMPRWWHRTRGRVLWAHVLRGGRDLLVAGVRRWIRGRSSHGS